MSLRTRTTQRRDDGTAAAGESKLDVTETPAFRFGTALFGGILAFNALENLRNLEGRIAYAEAKGAPAPSVSVPAISGGLLAGGIGLVLWRLPASAAAAIASFLIGVTPVMHDFWNVDDPEERQNELIHFLKNTALLGAALALLKVGQRDD
ncbi:DoxX family membrane protein [Natronolimnohabitans innermongolicus]|uniref:DoxX family protein n=1 Tax=Natronolimnohabitans innermongolicus JCM 12255 TaxID=1227499 RepID=L9WPK8_9EURY|nr:DoxX family membrane protein [Natronolimnohabitans innermongolicus]ELY51136.1 DoxX family protein [Natronolimnohabitans innermongolicus JCM 12255]